jgi:GxxExxY protein
MTRTGNRLPAQALTERMISVAIEVHRRLRPGFFEPVHQKALVIELKNAD